MIKAVFSRGDGDDDRFLLLGLLPETIDHLRAGQPILFDLSSVGMRLVTDEECPLTEEGLSNHLLLDFGELDDLAQRYNLPEEFMPNSPSEEVRYRRRDDRETVVRIDPDGI